MVNNNNAMVVGNDTATNTNNMNVYTNTSNTYKNITLAINYELPMVDQFLAAVVVPDSQQRRNFRAVEIPTRATPTEILPQHLPITTTTTTTTTFAGDNINSNTNNRRRLRVSNLENDTPNVRINNNSNNHDDDDHNTDRSTTTTTTTITNESHQQSNMNCSTPSRCVNHNNNDMGSSFPPPQQLPPQTPKSQQPQLQQRRISTREKPKREIPLSRIRVKYDMELVPSIVRQRQQRQQTASSCCDPSQPQPWWWISSSSSSSSFKTSGHVPPPQSSSSRANTTTGSTTNNNNNENNNNDTNNMNQCGTTTNAIPPTVLPVFLHQQEQPHRRSSRFVRSVATTTTTTTSDDNTQHDDDDRTNTLLQQQLLQRDCGCHTTTIHQHDNNNDKMISNTVGTVASMHESFLFEQQQQLTFSIAATTSINYNNNDNQMFDNDGDKSLPLLPDSVIWIPQKRSEWEDTVSEMTAVYTSATFRRRRRVQEQSTSHNNSSKNETSGSTTSSSPESFVPPVSSEYIRDRIDIDDPLYGYQIRHGTYGWLQGFILYTTFTTWNYGFEWNSHHPLCGMNIIATTCTGTTTGSANNNTATNTPSSSKARPTITATTASSGNSSEVVDDGNNNNSNNTHTVDYDNSLATELEALSRSGDPSAGGIVFSEIAEIAVLGALGCGEYLLRMALDDIYSMNNNSSNKPQYRYVVLHASDQARPFYEKFGFVRVGAVCQYSNKPNIPMRHQRQQQQQQAIPEPNAPDQQQKGVAVLPDATTTTTQVMGYRHWTHTNETEQSIETLHGAPSYMMCLKLPDRNHHVSTLATGTASSSIGRCNLCDGSITSKQQRQPPQLSNVVGPGEFLQQMLQQYRVYSKPRIEPLGTSTSLGMKHLAARRSLSMPLVTMTSSFDSQLSFTTTDTAGVKSMKQTISMASGKKSTTTKTRNGTKTNSSPRRKSFVATSFHARNNDQNNNITHLSSMRKYSSSVMNPLNGSSSKVSHHKKSVKRESMPKKGPPSPTNHRPTKRMKVERRKSTTTAPEILPIGPKRTSFAEKQYTSVWLAVPPNNPDAKLQLPRPRAPPKSRTDTPAVDVVRNRRDRIRKSAIETAKDMPLLNTAIPMNETSRRILPVISETDELNDSIDLNEEIQVQLPKVDELSQQPQPVKITRKRTFIETVHKPEKTKASSSNIVTTAITNGGNFPFASPRVSLFDVGLSDRDSLLAAGINTKTLRKQKVLSYPRNRVHFYNRVVRENATTTISKKKKGDDDTMSYFVLEYNEEKELICIVPMIVRGTLLGKRLGRPRYQCQMDHHHNSNSNDDHDETNIATNFMIVPTNEYTIVPSAMIMKTPIVAQEAWDIATETDVDFATR